MAYDSVDVENRSEPRIAVVGVGGAGCNIVSEVYGSLLPVDTIAINTDREGLHRSEADTKIYICKEVLKGAGTRGDAVIGKKCADIHKEEIRNALAGHDFVFVIAGLGGGTGTGATPVVLDAAESLGAMTFAVAIDPFSFETERSGIAKIGFSQIEMMCPRSILVENDLIAEAMPGLTLKEAFRQVNLSIMRHIIDRVETVNEIFADEMRRPPEFDSEEAPREALPITSFMSA